MAGDFVYKRAYRRMRRKKRIELKPLSSCRAPE